MSILLLGISAMVLLTESQLRQHKGSNIDVIDPTPFATKHKILGLRNMQVLAADNTQFIRRNIILDGARILDVTNENTLLPDVDYIDGNGNFLIPGLIDTHVHLVDSKNDLYLYLANGVTTVFEMYGTDTHLRWKKEADNGAISPTLFVASRKIGSREGVVPEIEDLIGNHINLTSGSDVEKVVRAHKDAGYDALKLSSYLTVDTFRQILAEAKHQELPVLGHLSGQIGLENLYGSGMAQIAHAEAIVKNTMLNMGNAWDRPDEYLIYLNSQIDAIAEQFASDDIAVSTTIWLGEQIGNQTLNIDDFIKTVPLQYVNAGVAEGSEMIKGWLPGHNEYEDPVTAANPEAEKKARAYYAAYVNALHIAINKLAEHEVTILAGTDANVPGVVPGFSIHDELESLAAIGLSNRAVLASATSAPADFADWDIGRIQIGHRADLVLLSENPLEDISNTRSIERVFFNGYSMNKKQIGNMLQSIEDTNNASRNVDISRYLQD
ncbi:MAG: amidohydrolase family protein [Pseudomonadota bacterium]